MTTDGFLPGARRDANDQASLPNKGIQVFTFLITALQEILAPAEQDEPSLQFLRSNTFFPVF